MKTKTREIKLTKREKDIIQLISEGYTDIEISEETGNSYSALRSVITNLYRKTSTLNRPHLVRWAFIKGILTV